MARYFIFEKTKTFNYKFYGTANGSNPNQALNRKMRSGMRSATIKRNKIYIAIPDKQFMKYQVNPTTKGKYSDRITTWKRPK